MPVAFYKLQSWHPISTFFLPKFQERIQCWLFLSWLKRFVKSNSSFLMVKKFEKVNSCFFPSSIHKYQYSVSCFHSLIWFMFQHMRSNKFFLPSRHHLIVFHHLENDKVEHALVIFFPSFFIIYLIYTIPHWKNNEKWLCIAGLRFIIPFLYWVFKHLMIPWPISWSLTIWWQKKQILWKIFWIFEQAGQFSAKRTILRSLIRHFLFSFQIFTFWT